MQTPAHSFWPVGHWPPQTVPSQVAVPLVGAGHAVHEDPHELVDWSLAQVVPQTWYPALQVKPHFVPSHVAVPCAGVTQGVHEVPHALGLAFGWHVPEQS
jgi:hypothetical protein